MSKFGLTLLLLPVMILANGARADVDQELYEALKVIKKYSYEKSAERVGAEVLTTMGAASFGVYAVSRAGYRLLPRLALTRADLLGRVRVNRNSRQGALAYAGLYGATALLLSIKEYRRTRTIGDYRTPEGLAEFLTLNVNRQLAIARTDRDFTAYLVFAANYINRQISTDPWSDGVPTIFSRRASLRYDPSGTKGVQLAPLFL